MQSLHLELNAWDAETSLARVGRLVRQYNALYMELGDVTHREMTPQYEPYKFYPKDHQVVHIMEDQIPRFGNPLVCWRYEDELEIGRCVYVAKSSNPLWLHRSIINKYRL